MTGSERAALRRLAMAATAGPWRIGCPVFRCVLDHGPGNHHGGPDCRYTFQAWDTDTTSISVAANLGPHDTSPDNIGVAGMWDYEQGGIRNEQDAHYIAAANPAAILALLNEFDLASAERDEHMDALRSVNDEADALKAKCDTLTALLQEARVFVQADADMMAAITRHAPLDDESQAKHDSTESASELLLPKIDAAMGA
jgi:hypothetical protein